MENKLNVRETWIVKDDRKVKFKTKNEFTMEHAVECVEAMNGNVEDLWKKTCLENEKRFMLTWDLVGSGGATLTTCRRDTHEVSNTRCLLDTLTAENRDTAHKKLNKSHSKEWIQFMQWLRQKKVTTLKHFKEQCE